MRITERSNKLESGVINWSNRSVYYSPLQRGIQKILVIKNVKPCSGVAFWLILEFYRESNVFGLEGYILLYQLGILEGYMIDER